MKSLSLVALAAFVAGCAIEPISERSTFLTYGHGSRESSFKDAYDHAAKKCEEKGLVAMHMSGICPDRCVTNFECVKR